MAMVLYNLGLKGDAMRVVLWLLFAALLVFPISGMLLLAAARCPSCGKAIFSQLPTSAVDERRSPKLLDTRSKAIWDIAIRGSYSCRDCGARVSE